MENKNKSLMDRWKDLFALAVNISHEDNPERQGWPLHSNNCAFRITNDKYVNKDVYYLCEVYLNKEERDYLYAVVEGLPIWVNTYLSGKSSIANKINKYTPENFEKMIAEYEEKLEKISLKRKEFIENNTDLKNMTYTRVFPRDFFNEAKLLKCIGRLFLLKLDGFMEEEPLNKIVIRCDSNGFIIGQEQSAGGLFILNMYSAINNEKVIFCTKYNSKEKYPLELMTLNYKYIAVFNEEGNFTTELIEYLNKIK